LGPRRGARRRRLGAEASGVRTGGEELGGADHADAGFGEQRGRELADEQLQLGLEIVRFGLERERPSRARAQRDDRRAVLCRLGGARAEAGAADELLVGRKAA
jgi:hypothetical protein